MKMHSQAPAGLLPHYYYAGNKRQEKIAPQLALEYGADLLSVPAVLFLKPYICTDGFLLPSFPVLSAVTLH